jgi:uncharacterized protein YjbI with pentapeptide repeats
LTDTPFASRWSTPEGQRLAQEVTSRLLRNVPLDDLGFGTHQGRIDLRGIELSTPTVEGSGEVAGLRYTQLGNLMRIQHVTWDALDLSFADLEHLRFVHTVLRNCVFDRATCHDWRLWACTIEDCSFVGADLSRAMLGAWYEGRGTYFTRVDFRRADLRNIVSSIPTYTDCDFSHAKITRFEFESSSFIRCRFAGPISHVIFYGRGLPTDKPDPNTMEDVDFSDAIFRAVYFRGLDLDRVKMPTAPGHIIVHRFKCTMRKILEAIEGDEHGMARGLGAVAADFLKWAGPDQDVGILVPGDFAAQGSEKYRLYEAVIREAEAACLAKAAEGGVSR